jgi:hypothetical protein
VRLAHVAKEPEHGNGREASRTGHIGDVQEAEVIVGVGVGAGGERGEDDDEAATSDGDCAQEGGE